MKPLAVGSMLLGALCITQTAPAQDMVGISWTNSEVWAIDSTTGATTSLGLTGFAQTNSLATTDAGVIYSAAGGDLITIDPFTGAGTTIGPFLNATIMRGLAYDETTSTLFGVTTGTLYSINTTTGEATEIGPTGATAIQGAESTPDGRLFVWNSWGAVSNGGLWELNKMTGIATQIGPSASLYNFLLSDSTGQLYTGRNLSMSIDTVDLMGNTAISFTHFASDLRGLDFFDFPSAFVSFCNGDGGTQPGCTDCPCGNNASAGTEGGCLNSAGTSGLLMPSGTPGTGANDSLRFEVSGASPNTFGILTSADNQLPNMGSCPSGSGIQSPVLDGLRCVGGSALRHGTRATDASGSIGITNNGWGPPNGPMGGLAANGGFVTGQTRHFQVFYRENMALGCQTGQNTTNAITVVFE